MKKAVAIMAIISIAFASCACDLLKFDPVRANSGRAETTDNGAYYRSYIEAGSEAFTEPDNSPVNKPELDIELDIEAGSNAGLSDWSAESEPGGLERDEYGILIGSIVFDEPILLVGAYDVINVRAGPDIGTQRAATIGLGQVAEASEVVDGWYHVTVLPGMFEGYVRSDLLVDYDDTVRYLASPRVDYIVRTNADGTETVTENTIVDVRTIIPDIEYYMIFATPGNFTGETLYARDIPVLQAGTAEKLKKAHEVFAQDGYKIKIYDAYRPSSISGVLYSIIQDSTYIAPAGTSMHNRAAAVDMTLVDFDGNELEMPSPMHTLNRTSNRDYQGMTAESRKNMDYMTSIMRQCGFTTVQSEWWHFSDSQISNYPPLDITFTEFSLYAVDK